jgi:hypothetical protein
VRPTNPLADLRYRLNMASAVPEDTSGREILEEYYHTRWGGDLGGDLAGLI